MPDKTSKRRKCETGASRQTQTISRRLFVEATTLAGLGLAANHLSAQLVSNSSDHLTQGSQEGAESRPELKVNNSVSVDEATKEKICRAILAGPSVITRNATVAEMDKKGEMTILRAGTNDWVCVPGDQNIIGKVDMCIDPMGMVWLKDLVARKPKPTNPTPGLIYMLNGATQRSSTDPFDTTSPAIPIGPHWMVLWPFDAESADLSTVMRDAGTMVMFAGTPWAHLHICGSPWDGNEYRPGDRGVWTMTYARSE